MTDPSPDDAAPRIARIREKLARLKAKDKAGKATMRPYEFNPPWGEDTVARWEARHRGTRNRDGDTKPGRS